MSMIGSYRMLNALENGTLSGAQLETLLATQRYEDEFVALLETTATAKRIASGLNTMTAIIASTVAMGALAASSVAMAAVAASRAAKMELFNSDFALTAVAASSAAITALRAAAGYSVVTTSSVTGTTSRAIPVSDTAGYYIALGVSTSDSSVGDTITVSTCRPGSTRANTHVTVAGSVSATTALGAIVCPMVAPFAAISTDNTAQTFSFGLLRCDV